MKLRELKQQIDELVSNGLGDLEVVDENKIAMEKAFVGNNKGKDSVIISYGNNPAMEPR